MCGLLVETVCGYLGMLISLKMVGSSLVFTVNSFLSCVSLNSLIKRLTFSLAIRNVRTYSMQSAYV